MKRVIVLLVAAIFLFAGSAFAAEKAGAAKPAKAAAMKFTGKIVDLSDTALKVERAAKGKTQTMDFSLTQPLSPDFKVGEKVVVNYEKKEGKNVATKVSKPAAKKSAKKK